MIDIWVSMVAKKCLFLELAYWCQKLVFLVGKTK